jgi:hypothetical protein
MVLKQALTFHSSVLPSGVCDFAGAVTIEPPTFRCSTSTNLHLAAQPVIWDCFSVCVYETKQLYRIQSNIANLKRKPAVLSGRCDAIQQSMTSRVGTFDVTRYPTSIYIRNEASQGQVDVDKASPVRMLMIFASDIILAINVHVDQSTIMCLIMAAPRRRIITDARPDLD